MLLFVLVELQDEQESKIQKVFEQSKENLMVIKKINKKE